MDKVLEVITKVTSLANAALAAGKDVAPFIAAIKNYFSKEAVTEADLDELEKEAQRLSDELQAPLPEGN